MFDGEVKRIIENQFPGYIFGSLRRYLMDILHEMKHSDEIAEHQVKVHKCFAILNLFDHQWLKVVAKTRIIKKRFGVRDPLCDQIEKFAKKFFFVPRRWSDRMFRIEGSYEQEKRQFLSKCTLKIEGTDIVYVITQLYEDFKSLKGKRMPIEERDENEPMYKENGRRNAVDLTGTWGFLSVLEEKSSKSLKAEFQTEEKDSRDAFSRDSRDSTK